MGDLDMKLPTFKSLDEKMKSMANEVFPPLHPAWSGENNQAYQDGFESGVIERDKMWQSKVSKLLEALEYYRSHPAVIKDAYHSNNEGQITVVHTFINHVANNALAEFYGEEK